MMKASVNEIYGGPEVLQIKEVPKPQVKDNEVLIKVHATTVNRTDCGFRQPEYLLVRLISGLFKPKNTILGSEFAGTICELGKNISKFKLRDEVFGLKTYHFGTHAEYVCLKESGSIALKPSNMTFQEAASVCDGLMLAINYIRAITFYPGIKILINGASGSIGSAAIQLAKYHGAHITAVCKTSAIETVQSLGADVIIDYLKEDFTKLNEQFDVVLDSVGKSTYFKCKRILKAKGVYFSSELGPWGQNVFLPLSTFFLGGKRVKFPIPTDNQKDIEFFKELIEQGHFKALIDRTYPLDEIVEATRYVETGEKIGNVVIDMEVN